MSELAIYRDEQHAIVRAMSLDAITTCKPAQWQQQYSSGYVEDVKSEATKNLPVYRLKIHLMNHIHGLDVTEI